MKYRNMMAVLGVAAVTMAFTLAMFGSLQVRAVDRSGEAPTEIKPVIGQPTLEIAGLRVTLTTDKPVYHAGDAPVIMLEAQNPTDKPVRTKVWIGMTASSPAARMSRALTMPEYFWSKDCPLEVASGQTKKFRISSDKPLEAGKLVSLTMSDVNQKEAFSQVLNLRRGARRAPESAGGAGRIDPRTAAHATGIAAEGRLSRGEVR